MGFNFIGIIIKKNYQNNIEELNNNLGGKYSYEKEIYSEEAMSSHKPDNACDIHFIENGTLVFFPEPVTKLGVRQHSKDNQISNFMVSETSMVFDITSRYYHSYLL